MATNTYVALDKITVGTATSSVTFSSIASTYTDLVLVTSIQRTASGNTRVRFNGDTATNYSTTYIEGNGTAASSSRNTNQTYMTLDYSNSTSNWVPSVAHIMNYANTTTNKTMISRTGDAGVVVLAYAQLWRSTAAITSLTCISDTTFAAGSTFSLYGIKAATASVVKATGGTISFDTSGNVIHTFTSSGTFTPTQSLTADYLVVAGGGGSGGGNTTPGGGGGAGGLRSTVTATGGGGSLETPLSLTATGYTVTIGAGGTGDASGGGGSTAGANSVFSTITSAGGGKGSSGLGGNGGSGGGTGNGAGFGSGTANQGRNGGTMFDSTFVRTAGGGGGADTAGTNATNPNAGNGGAGVAVAITGTSVTYAGGGGGGAANQAGGGGSTGGAGGGGNGGVGGSGVAGTVNTGGGAGGSGNWFGATAGLQGGSGIVIIRYAG